MANPTHLLSGFLMICDMAVIPNIAATTDNKTPTTKTTSRAGEVPIKQAAIDNKVKINAAIEFIFISPCGISVGRFSLEGRLSVVEFSCIKALLSLLDIGIIFLGIKEILGVVISGCKMPFVFLSIPFTGSSSLLKSRLSVLLYEAVAWMILFL